MRTKKAPRPTRKPETVSDFVRIAAHSGTDYRTCKSAYTGKPVRPTKRSAIEMAATLLDFEPPPVAPEAA